MFAGVTWVAYFCFVIAWGLRLCCIVLWSGLFGRRVWCEAWMLAVCLSVILFFGVVL